MKPSDTFEPVWVSPPGDTIAGLLKSKGLEAGELADFAGERIGVIEDVLEGRAKITKSLAKSLADLLGGSLDFWVSRERQYREDLSRYRLLVGAEEIDWLAEIPVSELIGLRWLIEVSAKTRLSAVLDFFGVDSIEEWRNRYKGLASAVSFRTSPVFSSHLGAVLVWLRRAEAESVSQPVGLLDIAKLRLTIPEMRKLTRHKNASDFLPKLRVLCNAVGLSLVIAPAPKGCRASGATWIVDSGSAICVLSHRYGTDDQFWFTFFHEMGHLCLHSDRALFLEDGDELRSMEEEEANRFSEEVLIPQPWRSELADLPKAHRPIIQFAMRIGVSAGIVVGQMQHHKSLPPNWLNSLKRRLVWS